MECKQCGSMNWGVVVVSEANFTKKNLSIIPCTRVKVKCNVCGHECGKKDLAILKPRLDQVLLPFQAVA